MKTPHFDHEFEIVTLKSGIKSLRSLVRKETFHPTTGPLGEANALHVHQQRLVERCLESKKFILWDVGFGAAANGLAALFALKDCETEIEFHSFDLTTKPIEFALEHAEDLDYVKDYEPLLQALLKEGSTQIRPRFSWHLHLGDFSQQVQPHPHAPRDALAPAPHAIFYDPYSAASNPEMWTLEHFRNLYLQLDPKQGCLLTNYTRSTAVRVALLLAGFYVGKGCIIGEKAETTVVSNQLELLEHPLDRSWLERVKNSTNAAPLRASAYTKSKISQMDFEQLQQSPQFLFGE